MMLTIPLVVAGALPLALALFVWRRRATRGAVPFVLLMLAIAAWVLGYGLEVLAGDLASKKFWASAKYIGIVLTPLAWLLFALDYSGRTRWLTWWRAALLLVEPTLTVALAFTNPAHHLMWGEQWLVATDSLLILDGTFGPWFWLHAIYSYLVLLTGTVILVRALLRSPQFYRGQLAALLMAVALPWLGNALLLAGRAPVQGLDPTPYTFVLTGGALAWGLFRYRLLDIVPVARDALIETMPEGMLVLDERGRAVDVNPAAQRLLVPAGAPVIGRTTQDLLERWPALLAAVGAPAPSLVEVTLGEAEGTRSYEVQVSPLARRRDETIAGRLLVFRDVTERRRAEEERLRLLASEAAARAEAEAARLQGVLLAVNTVQHYLNNQLAVVIGFGELLAADTSLPEQHREPAQLILESGRAAAATLARLQGITRLEERRRPGLPPMLDLDRSVE